MIILDANVVSELMRPEPDARVRQWVTGLRADELGTTAVTVAEIRHGIERLPDGRRKKACCLLRQICSPRSVNSFSHSMP
jgi:predicted nucleic acid-binding protein